MTELISVGQVSLRKVENQPDNQKKNRRRSKSVSRDAKSIEARILEQQRIKLVRTQQIAERLQAEREKQEEQYTTPRKRTPVVAKARKPQNTSPWDENGRLIHRDETPSTPKQEQNTEPIPSFKSCMNESSVAMLKRHDHLSLSDRQLVKKKKPRRSRSMSMSHESFESFCMRQERAAHRKIAVTEIRPRRYSSVMSPMSRKIVENVDHPPKKRPAADDDFTFMPDLSLTRHVQPTGLGCRESVARKVIVDLQLAEEARTRQDKQMARCTFRPDFSLTREKWPAQQSPIRKFVHAETVEPKVVPAAAPRADTEEAAEYIRYVHEIPPKQMVIHEMMAMFRAEKRKNRDPIDTGKRQRRSASVPRVSK